MPVRGFVQKDGEFLKTDSERRCDQEEEAEELRIQWAPVPRRWQRSSEDASEDPEGARTARGASPDNVLVDIVRPYLQSLWRKVDILASQPPLLLNRNNAKDVRTSVVVVRRTLDFLQDCVRRDPAKAEQIVDRWVYDPSTQRFSAAVAVMVSSIQIRLKDAQAKDRVPCPPGLEEKYWRRRYFFWSRFDEGCRMDEAAWFELTPEAVSRHIAQRIGYRTVIDGCAGVGGNVIQFAETAKRVIGVDIDGARLAIGKHNAKVYECKNVEFVEHDFITWAEKQEFGDSVVFVSPPWGGPCCFDVPAFGIKQVEVPDITDMISAAFSMTNDVVIYLPRNTDINDLAALAALHGVTEIEVEKIAFADPFYHVKALCVYMSRDVASGPFQTEKNWMAMKMRWQGVKRVNACPPPALYDTTKTPLASALARSIYMRVNYVGKSMNAAIFAHKPCELMPLFSEEKLVQDCAGFLSKRTKVPRGKIIAAFVALGLEAALFTIASHHGDWRAAVQSLTT